MIEWRFAEGNPDRLPALMTELVRLNVDVIVSAGQQSPVPPRKRQERSRSSWLKILIPWGTGLSRALRGRAVISLDCPPTQLS